jgi:2-dehydro-3-deoxyphosphogluconate aldolase/(4S)-4-hydroxy-2-oxoglutarate aldolase
MTKIEIGKRIHDIGVIPAVRVATAVEARFAAEAIAAGGLPVVEITLTIGNALDVVRGLVTDFPDVLVGAGTVLTAEMAKRSLGAGAHFLTSPLLKEDVMKVAHETGTLVIPGAMTPTEILHAWEAGADYVKVFPCSALGGANYIRALKPPLPDIPLIAAGGINQQNAAEYIRAGANMIGIGTGLVSAESVSHHESKRIRELARRYVSIVSLARQKV